MKLFTGVLLLFVATVASCQTISPLVAEGGKGHARGEFTVVNNALVPTVVTIEPRALKFSTDGQMKLADVGDVANIILSEMSTKLGPKQTHIFQYDIRCQKDCAVALYAAFTGAKPVNGVQIALHLPTSIYLCQDKAKDCRRRIRQSWGLKN